MTARGMDAVVEALAGKYGLSDVEANVVRAAFFHLRNTPADAAVVMDGELGREARVDGASRPVIRLRWEWVPS